jgi:hypothetical protein
VQETDQPPQIECCDAQGDMISELKAIEYISDFVSGGPKNHVNEVCNSVTGEAKTVKCGALHSIIRPRNS